MLHYIHTASWTSSLRTSAFILAAVIDIVWVGSGLWHGLRTHWWRP